MKLLFALLTAAAAGFAASTTTWELSTFADFARGRLQGLAISRDGRLQLAPRAETIFSSDEPQIWSVVRDAAGSFYAATGHRGRVYKITAQGQASVLWTAAEPEVFALALDPAGVLYAATSPDGKIYRIENGKATEYFQPKAKYIWSLAWHNGVLYAGTGDQGRIYRITAAGQGELYYDSGQQHITALALDPRGALLAGSEPNGILYRVTAKDKAFALYDANLPEIRAIVPLADGTIYTAALGGSIAKRTNPAAAIGGTSGNVSVSATSTSITVTDAQAGLPAAPKPDAPKQQQTAATGAAVASVYEMPGVERSAIYRIRADLTVETLWTSKEENAYDLVSAGADLVFVTDVQGRVYRLGADRKTTLVAQIHEAEAVRVLETPQGWVAATGNMGKLVRLGAPSAQGVFESPVHDAGAVARWGRLDWKGAGAVKLYARSGNAARPDNTWSDWAPVANERVASPNARFVQWKAELESGAEIAGVTLSYLPQNTPPVARSVTVTGTAAPAPAAKPAASSATAAYTITVTDTGEASTPAGTTQQTVNRVGAAQLTVTWQAEDPDNDKLTYTLQVRGEDEREWRTLRSNIAEAAALLDADAFADGRYFFKLIASDRSSNPPADARESEVMSAPVLIDNTPPVVTVNGMEITARDAASPLRRCEYSVDAGAWTLLAARDGVIDGREEQFTLQLEKLAPGEHVVVVRAIDAAGNAGLAKIVLRNPERQ